MHKNLKLNNKTYYKTLLGGPLDIPWIRQCLELLMILVRNFLLSLFFDNLYIPTSRPNFMFQDDRHRTLKDRKYKLRDMPKLDPNFSHQHH